MTRTRKPALILAALAAALAAGLSAAPAALADCVSDASVTYVGSDWGPVPMWRVSVPSLNATWDVQASDADAARAAVAPFVTCPTVAPPAVAPDVTAPDATPAPAPSGSAPSDLALGQAAQLAAEAVVTYLGNSWGPVPVWRVSVPSRNATYDVAAMTADDARAAVIPVIAAGIDQNPNVAPAVPAAQAPALAVSSGAPVPVAPAPAVPQKTPAKSTSARRGVHHAPATSRIH